MERGTIKADDRHIARSIRAAIQGNVIRALVELITNADDSYIRSDRTSNKSCIIEILYKKDSYRGLFAVRDNAEGMSKEDVKTKFVSKYGAATSGMQAGKKVRGFFGQGATDALAAMKNGRIFTFKDEQFVECRLFMNGNKTIYEIEDPVAATSKLRAEHKVDRNGTIAYFEAERRVPRLDRLQEELANNYLLRKIMTNPYRKIFLLDENSDKKRRLRYQMPKGKEILADKFTITYGQYGDFPINISVWRSEKELTQTGDDRHGGLLLLDDENTVLGISLFKYDNEPLASHFFGEVKIGRFRELLKKEEPVLRSERTGLDPHHEFCKILTSKIEKYLEIKVKEERLRKQKESQIQIDREATRRYKKAFNILNEIAEIEAQSVVNLGQEPTDQIQKPPDGFCLYPSSAQITVGKRYGFQLHLDTNIVRYGSIIKVSSSNPKIRVITPKLRISSEDGVDIMRKHITVEGIEPNIEGILRATTGSNMSQAKISVIPEKELLMDEGMVFQPETLTLRPNKPRKVFLLIYIKMIEGGSTIKISSDNESIHVSKDKIIVNEADAKRHVAKYELDVWGEGAGQDAVITAEHQTYMALLDARIRSKENTKDKSRKGMFSEPEPNYDPHPLQRTSYSAETGKVIIYVNFPSIKHYLGDTCQYMKTLPAQVLVADLLAERCFLEIARKKVESSGAILRPAAKPDRVQRDAQELSLKYGKKIHEALVAQDLIDRARSISV
ncbi:MAG: ATP-binding protein [Deltaproteobacteria bacterium]|nr:ATP-binding protein [Deltaproteobacteria bacterium]